MMPGKLIRTNEVLTHLGSEYYAWRTVPSALEIITRRQKEIVKQIETHEETLKTMDEKKQEVTQLIDMKKIYEKENITEIQETEDESDAYKAEKASEEDIAQFFEIEEEERRKHDETAWSW
jgi:hypothetical protein